MARAIVRFWIDQSIGHSLARPVDSSTDRSVAHSLGRPVGRSVSRSFDQSLGDGSGEMAIGVVAKCNAMKK